MQIDRSGEMPLDKCLRLWDLSSIKKLLGKYYSRIPTLMLTSSCLNKILINCKLKQKDKGGTSENLPFRLDDKQILCENFEREKINHSA